MPIVETVISSEIVKFMTDAQDEGVATEADTKKMKAYADNLAGVIANAIKSATVTVVAGIPVATAGSPTAQVGATTATGTGTLS